MNDKDQIKKIEDFITGHKLAVLSTVTHDAKPESAVVGFAEFEDLVLMFGTYSSSRKYKNLQANPEVSLVIGWEAGKTVQYEGEAREITDSVELENCKRVFLASIPSAAKYVHHEEEKFFKVTPKWIRYTDLSRDPWDVFEITF